MPLCNGSPYNAAKVGFFLLAVRGVFNLDGVEAFRQGNFQLETKRSPGL